jgi:hypothetical protein
MPWVVRDAVDEINRAVGRRWQGLDRLLPPPSRPAEGCTAPLVATGANGRPAGLAVCRHEHVPDGTLNQTWMGYRPLWTGWEARPAESLR